MTISGLQGNAGAFGRPPLLLTLLLGSSGLNRRGSNPLSRICLSCTSYQFYPWHRRSRVRSSRNATYGLPCHCDGHPFPLACRLVVDILPEQSPFTGSMTSFHEPYENAVGSRHRASQYCPLSRPFHFDNRNPPSKYCECLGHKAAGSWKSLPPFNGVTSRESRRQPIAVGIG